MTTKDIILRAEQYANKENADFYSYAEKVAMLNESWTTLYQYLCNTGDKYWCKRVEFSGKELTLPADCYQISAVYRKAGRKEDQVYRYSLFNNIIKLDEDLYSSSYSYELEYYPIPQVLSFRDVVKKCPFQLTGMQDITDGKVLRHDGSRYVIYDTVTKQDINLPLTGKWDWIHIYKDSAIVGIKDNNCYIFYDNVIRGATIIVIYNNNVHHVIGSNLVDVKGNVICPWTLTEPGWYTTDDFINFKKSEGVLVVNNSVSIIPETLTGVANSAKSYTLHSIVGYYDTNSFLTKDSLTGTFYIESEYNDVNINYPNNVFFTFLALDIALKMRSKQGIDNTQLDSQWTIAKNALFNSIEKNKGSHVTIKDVYNHDESFGIYY